MSGPRLARLVGLPSTYLNDIESKYDKGEIKDLLLFLHGGWAEALYHDRFPDLRMSILNNLHAAGDASSEPEVKVQKKIEGKLREFLMENSTELSVYQVA